MIRLRLGLSTALAVQKWSPLVSWENSAPTRFPKLAGSAVGVPVGGWARRKRSRLQVVVLPTGLGNPDPAQPPHSAATNATATMTLRIATPSRAFFPYEITRQTTDYLNALCHFVR